ncbi:DUF4114 domain-containing protein [filamentous cyanobacterium LEGE 11480]|uniref:DUF4114 domain-containing protein n=1 Tax=Romeriopsis navalis LEGE 11480 TaxID=2777977 RepID=A0A928Z6G4_9CYAN|nr:DUF4114 domain-containing protein [Romeriopsis navalis]MBE9032987.1 DUF4114 domain-containing protein [Romeriopsis navalis LEGE 11480]
MQKQLALTFAGLATIALTGFAKPAQANVTFGTSHDTNCVAGNTAEACSLQSLLNYYTTSGPQIDTTQDTGYELFTNTGNSATSSFLFSIAGFAPDNTFGLYKASDPNTKIELFGGGTAGGTESEVSFLANGAVQVGSNIVNNFGSDFGFYLGGPGGTFFSQNALNGGNQHSAIYQGNGQTKLNVGGKEIDFDPGKYLVAFEDVSFLSSDKDYNDLVVVIDGVRSKDVPEPAIMLGLAAVAGGAVATRRRHKQS